MRITHVKQPTKDTCVSACLAMVLGVDVHQVIEDFHQQYVARELDVVDYLESKGLVPTLMPDDYYLWDKSEDRWIEHPCNFTEPGLYFVTVNSLNVEGQLHQILVVVSPQDLVQTIYDPQYGNDCVSYSPQDKDFRTFVAIDCMITPKEYDFWQFKTWWDAGGRDLRAPDVWLAACEYARR